jgi:hypothetical protein
MRKGKLIGWGVAITTAAAVVTAGTVYAASSPAQVSPSASYSMNSLRNVLVPISQQTPTRFVHGPMTLAQAGEQDAFAAPPGMVFSPRSCATYVEDVLGPLESLNGWIQYGSRVHDTHNDNFIQAVVQLPTNADLGAIAAAAATCEQGTLTLEGQVTGQITYTPHQALNLPGASTFAVRGETHFSAVPGTPEYNLVAQYEMPPDAQLLVNNQLACIAETNFVAQNNILIVVMEADLAYSNQITSQMFGRLQGLGGATSPQYSSPSLTGPSTSSIS